METKRRRKKKKKKKTHQLLQRFWKSSSTPPPPASPPASPPANQRPPPAPPRPAPPTPAHTRPHHQHNGVSGERLHPAQAGENSLFGTFSVPSLSLRLILPVLLLPQKYEQCFNYWYSEKYLKGDNKPECEELYKEYQNCVLVRFALFFLLPCVPTPDQDLTFPLSPSIFTRKR